MNEIFGIDRRGVKIYRGPQLEALRGQGYSHYSRAIIIPEEATRLY